MEICVIRLNIIRAVNKYDEGLFMMEDCWYGINCRRQNQPKHAQDFNHMCE